VSSSRGLGIEFGFGNALRGSVVRPDTETADCAIQAAKSRLAGGH
jgi:hypothetical protein